MAYVIYYSYYTPFPVYVNNFFKILLFGIRFRTKQAEYLCKYSFIIFYYFLQIYRFFPFFPFFHTIICVFLVFRTDDKVFLNTDMWIKSNRGKTTLFF